MAKVRVGEKSSNHNHEKRMTEHGSMMVWFAAFRLALAQFGANGFGPLHPLGHAYRAISQNKLHCKLPYEPPYKAKERTYVNCTTPT
jgi:hypothetical protein